MRNTSSALWKGGGDIRLAAYWLDESRRRLAETRFPLEADVYPGQETVISGTMTSPASPGAYVLGLDLVQGASAWLSTLGVTPERMAVTVR